MSTLRVDHVIYAVDDLEAAGRWFAQEFGLASVEGGRHPDWGTANRIVPLGSAYVELVAVVDPQVAASSDFGRPVLDAVAIHEPLVGWAVATTELQGVARRLDLDVARGSRTKPDGTNLSWQLAGVAPALDAGALPFFIEWGGPPTQHPGRAKAEHRVTPSGIAWVQVAYGEDAMRAWLGDDVNAGLLFVDGPTRLSAVAVSTEAGEVVLR